MFSRARGGEKASEEAIRQIMHLGSLVQLGMGNFCGRMEHLQTPLDPQQTWTDWYSGIQ